MYLINLIKNKILKIIQNKMALYTLCKTIKILIFNLIIMTFSLSACSTPASRDITSARTALEVARDNSMINKATTTITTEISSMLNGTPFNISMSANSVHSYKEGEAVKTITTSIGDEKSEELIYVTKDDKPYLYSSKDVKKELTEPQFESIMASLSEPIYFNEFIENASNFSISDNDNNYILKGSVYIDDILKTLQYIGFISNMEALSININEIEKDTPIPVAMHISKDNGHIKFLSINLTNAGGKTVSSTLANILSIPLDMLSLQLKSFSVSIDIQSGDIEDIVKPTNVLS